jgi:hypothetical protein
MGSSMFVQRSTFNNCNSNYGGSIYVGAEHDSLSFRDLIFSNGETSICKCSQSYTSLFNFDYTLFCNVAGTVYFAHNNYNIDISYCQFKNIIAGGGVFIGHSHQNVFLAHISAEYCYNEWDSGGVVAVGSSNRNITVQNSEFKHSSALLGGGLAVTNNNTQILLSNISIWNCSATNGGAGLYFNMFNSNISISSVISNSLRTGTWGGSVMYFADSNTNISIRNSSFFQSFTEGLGGCFMFGSGANVLIQDCLFDDFTAFSDGGAINFNQRINSVQIVNATFRNGVCRRNGGAFSIGQAVTNFNLRNVSIANVTAIYGGCIKVGSASAVSFEQLHLVDCVGDTAGGIYADTLDQFTMTDSSISHASSKSSSGGGIYLNSFVRNIWLENVIISFCHAMTSGGGVFINQNNPQGRIVHCKFIQNDAYTNGGGLYLGKNNTQFMIAGTQFIKNTASEDGGGMYVLQDNYQLAIMDGDAFNDFQILETSHPYVTHFPDSGPDIIFNKSVLAIGATGFLLNFDSDSFIDGLSTLTIYDNTNKNFIYWSSATIDQDTGSSVWPGKDGPPLQLTGNSYFIEFVGPTSSDFLLQSGYYGFKLYSYPITSNAYFPSVFHSNQGSGIAGALFMFYANMFSVVINTLVINNTVWEGNGGGIFLQVGNGGNSFVQVMIEDNTAKLNGGGIALLSGQFGITISNCSINNNAAVEGFGGGVYLSTGNGDGVLPTNNYINIANTIVSGNSAFNGGGGIYAGQSNSITMTNSTIQFNHAMAGNGGGIRLDSSNYIFLKNSTLNTNAAIQNCGGAISSEDRNQIDLWATSIISNTASMGGGICWKSSTTSLVFDKLFFDNNCAFLVGGGAVFLSSPFFSTLFATGITFSNNKASRGSAFSLFKSTNDESIANVNFFRNNASIGGTVYWVVDSVMTDSPSGLQSSTNVWVENSAPYGKQWATQGIILLTPKSYDVVTYGSAISPAITIQMKDFYGQFIPLTGQTAVTTTILSHQCTQYPHLSGPNAFGSGAVMKRGDAVFDSLEVYCSPLGNLTLSFTANLGSETSLPASSLQPYYISNTTFLTFRSCIAGEYHTGSLCEICALSTFSLMPNSEQCTSCANTVGVQKCISNSILLEAGFWRRFPTNKAVLTCSLTTMSCVGGNATGQGLCAIGYEGELCAVCSLGFFNENSECKPCTTSNKVTPLMIAALLIVFLILTALLIYVYYRYIRISDHKMKDLEERDDENPDIHDTPFSKAVGLRPSHRSQTNDDETFTTIQLIYLWLQAKYEQVMVKLKIVVCTFQVVTATSTVFNVKMPRSFTTFENSFNFMNLSFTSLFPIGCQGKFNFIDTVLWTTLVPIAISFLLFLAYSMEINWSELQVRRGHRDSQVVSKSKELSKSRYLNFFFYLTYLVLPSVTTTIFQMFICTNVDPNGEDDALYDSFLSVDMSISCQSPYYQSWVLYSVLMIVLYPIGIPALYLSLLYSNRQEISNRHQFNNRIDNRLSTNSRSSDLHIAYGKSSAMSPSVSRLAFLWQAYEPQYWYWEVVETTRRIMLTAVLSVAGPGTSEQSVLSVLLALMYIKLYSHYNPYQDDSDDVLAETGQFQIFFTFFVALIIQNQLMSGSWNTFLGVLLAFMNVVVIFLTFYFAFASYYADIKKVQEEAEENRRRMRAIATTHREQFAKALSDSTGCAGISRFEKRRASEIQFAKQNDIDGAEEIFPPFHDHKANAQALSNASITEPIKEIELSPIGKSLSPTKQPSGVRLSVVLDSDDEYSGDELPSV